MVESGRNSAITGGTTCDAAVMQPNDQSGSSPAGLTLRPYTDDDLAAFVAVEQAQDLSWWGEVDSDEDDATTFIAQAIAEHGSADAGTRLAVVDGRVIGLALLLGHGQTSLAIDPTAPHAAEARRRLIDWLTSSGATRIDSPGHDVERLADLAERGFLPRLASFDLERGADVDDLGAPQWPDEVEVVAFRPGDDDQAVHDLIYSVWTDVEGHTYRPIEEWRAYFASGSWFDPGLVVLTRTADGAFAGVAMCRTFGDIGWVMQLAVGRPARGLGLGRAVLVEAFRRLAALPEVARLGLSVETANDTALGLYRSVGLEVTREWSHCERPRPDRSDPDPSTAER